MQKPFVFLFAAAVLAMAAPAHAQLIGQPGGAAVPVVGIHAFFIVEAERMSARQSFEASLMQPGETDSVGKSTLAFTGGGVEITGLWKGVFARFAATTSKNDGTRVFIDDAGKAYSLNIPMTVEVTPIEIGGGWRFGNVQRQRALPYVGAAVLVQRYREMTENAASRDENVETTDKGESIFAGVLAAFGPARVGAELQYRNVPIDAESIGPLSALSAYKETNLGGTVFRITFGIGF